MPRPTMSITRCFTFDAGHRVYGHEGKCRHLHGHTYQVELTVTAPQLDPLGRVIDFSVIKDKVVSWVDDNLDHVTLLKVTDPLTQVLDGAQQRVYSMADNPTAENIAALLFHQTRRILKADGIRPIKVRVWETKNCYADYYEEAE